MDGGKEVSLEGEFEGPRLGDAADVHPQETRGEGGSAGGADGLLNPGEKALHLPGHLQWIAEMT